MIKSKNGAGLFLALFGVLFLGLVSGVPGTDPPVADTEMGPRVEVHGPDIAYVPLNAKYVTYDGVVHKITRFASAAGAAPGECNCPSCCDGACYIVVYSNVLALNGPPSLYFIWIDC